MRKPEKQRWNPKNKYVAPPPPDVDLLAVSLAASYVGSVQHKDSPSFAGPLPHPLATRSVCPRRFARQQALVQGWLSASIAAGRFGPEWRDGFPRYVWHVEGTERFEGQLMSPPHAGCYKGYPLEPHQTVRGLQ